MKVSFLWPVLFSLSLLLAPGQGHSQPAIVGPANGSELWNQVYFDWVGAAGETFQLQVDTSGSFNSPVLMDTVIQNHEFLRQGFFFGEVYFWRVRNTSGGNISPWSAVYSFLTADAVPLISPGEGSFQPVSLVLDWTSHWGVDVYDLQLDTTPLFNSPVLFNHLDTNYLNIEGFSDTEEEVQDLFFGTVYYWRVRARHSFDQSAWTTGSFITQSQPGITGPANGSTTPPGLMLNWTSISGATLFEIQLDTTANYDSPLLQTLVDTFLQTGNSWSDTEEWVEGLHFGASYHWRVRAIHSSDTSAWANGWFQTSNSVSLSSPSSGFLALTQVLLNWNAVAGVSFYDWQLDTIPSFNSAAIQGGSNAYLSPLSTNTDTEVTVANLLFDQDYYWRVRARTLTDTSLWSVVWSFSTFNTPGVISPVGGITDFTGVFLEANAFAGTTQYLFQLDTSLSFVSPASNQVISPASTGYAEGLMFGTGYYWRVAMINGNDTSAWSTPGQFFTYDYPGLLSPVDMAINQNVAGVTLDWSSHRGATWYILEVDTVNSFDSPFLIHSNQAYIDASPGNADTRYELGPLLANQVYFWRVKVHNAHDESQWETRWFTTGSSAPFIPAIPLLLVPMNNETNLPISVNLMWLPVTGADGYHVQISDNPSFALAPQQWTTASQLLQNLNYGTSYYWRVRAVKNSMVSGWSEVFEFSTAPDVLIAPVLVSPPDLSTGNVLNGLALQWQSVTNAETYHVQLASDPQFFFDLQEDTVSGWFASFSDLEPSSVYFWRVRALSPVLGSSPWSQVFQFTTMGMLGIPQLLSPVNLSVQLDFEAVQLSWAAVPDAQSYRVEWSLSDNFTLGTNETELQALIFDLPELLPDTTYFWRVKALSSAMIPGNWSIPWQFSTMPDSTIGWTPPSVHPSPVLFPIPSTGIVNIDSGSQDGPLEIQVFDLAGRLLFVNRYETGERAVLFLPSGSNGLFLVQVRSKEMISIFRVPVVVP